MKNYLNTTAKRIALGALLGVLAFISVLPWLVKAGLIYFLKSSGVGDASIANTDVNLFNGRFVVDQLLIERAKSEKLYLGSVRIDVDMGRLLLGEVQVEQVDIADSRLWLVQNVSGWEFVVPIQNAGDVEAAAPEDGLVLPRLGAHVATLSNVKLSVDSNFAKGQLQVNRLHLERASSWNQLEETQLDLDADWGDAKLDIKVSANLLAAAPHLKGRFTLSNFPLAQTLNLLQPEVSDLVGQLNINLDFTAQKSAGQLSELELQGDISVAGLTATRQYTSLKADEVRWSGTLNARQISEQLELALVGDVAVNLLALKQKGQPELDVVLQSFSLDGLNLSYQAPANTYQLAVKQILLEGIALQNAAIPSAQLALDKLRLNDLQLADDNSAALASVLVEGIRFNRPVAGEAFDLQLAGLEVGPVHYLGDTSRLELGRIHLVDTELVVRIDQHGQMELPAAMAQLMPEVPQPTESEISGAPNQAEPSVAVAEVPLQWSLAELVISGKSWLQLVDQRLEPVAKLKVELDSLKLGPISTSESAEPARIEASARMDRYGVITVGGEGRFLGPSLSLSLQGEMREMPLQLFSPYSAAYIGYFLKSGQLDHDFEIVVGDELLKMQNTLMLRGLELSSIKKGEVKMLGEPLAIPMDIALDLLRDKQGNIELKVPLEGKLNDPDINSSHVINTALSKALRGGASAFLKLAIQPYGAILMAGEMIVGQMTNIRLDPLEFAPGGTEPLVTQQDYLKKIGGLLSERPGLQLTICGLSNAADSTVLVSLHPEQTVTAEELLGLAEARANQVKGQLVVLGVASSRLLLCKPQYQVDGKSAAELAL